MESFHSKIAHYIKQKWKHHMASSHCTFSMCPKECDWCHRYCVFIRLFTDISWICQEAEVEFAISAKVFLKSVLKNSTFLLWHRRHSRSPLRRCSWKSTCPMARKSKSTSSRLIRPKTFSRWECYFVSFTKSSLCSQGSQSSLMSG